MPLLSYLLADRSYGELSVRYCGSSIPRWAETGAKKDGVHSGKCLEDEVVHIGAADLLTFCATLAAWPTGKATREFLHQWSLQILGCKLPHTPEYCMAITQQQCLAIWPTLPPGARSATSSPLQKLEFSFQYVTGHSAQVSKVTGTDSSYTKVTSTEHRVTWALDIALGSMFSAIACCLLPVRGAFSWT